jgi:hypothetical protein
MCSKSPDYHFVNDYLYKPVNQMAANAYNETLRYADRFFPDGYSGAGNELLGFNPSTKYYQDEEESEEEIRPVQQRQQVVRDFPRENYQQQQQPRQFVKQFVQQQQAKSSNLQAQKAYFDPNLINIPLQQRRPSGFRPSLLVGKKEFY